jgi:hypothetical protein
MDKFLKYLICKFLYFQIKVGNKDCALFMSILMILFSLFLYLSMLGFILLWIFPNIFNIVVIYSSIFGCIFIFAFRLISLTNTTAKRQRIIKRHFSCRGLNACIYFVLSLLSIISLWGIKCFFNNIGIN